MKQIKVIDYGHLYLLSFCPIPVLDDFLRSSCTLCYVHYGFRKSSAWTQTKILINRDTLIQN